MDQQTTKQNTLASTSAREDLLTLDSNSVGNKSQDKFVSGCKDVPISSCSSSMRHHHLKDMYYKKFLPKTQSLDIVDEVSIANITNPHCFESINEELLMTDSSEKANMISKHVPLDHSSCSARPIYPNLTYSPYSSPRSIRKPAKESRLISIDHNGSFLQLNQYKLMDQIGAGSYGLVKLAYNEEDSQHYAMKILSKKKLLRKAGIGLNRNHPKRGIATTPLDRVYREIAVLKKLDHPNVVKLVEVLDDPANDALYMVFELVTLGEVLNIPTDKPLTEERAWFIFRQVILGVEYLFLNRIIHGDLKPNNLLLAEGDIVKVADLGVCNEVGDDAQVDQRTGVCSTPAFRSPETLSSQKFYFDGKKADIWALGITLYCFVYGDIPWNNCNSIPVLYEQIKNNEVTFPTTIKTSDELKDLIGAMLIKNPDNRINMEQIKEHKWITKNGTYPMPCQDKCQCLVEISEEDINSVVKSIPKLDTLILIKKMLKNHSFQNPFLTSAIGTSTGIAKSLASRLSKLERFQSSRSNSAPGNYQTLSPSFDDSSQSEVD